MDKWQVQYDFWSQFGVPAYEENSVPDLKEVIFPYITYEASGSGFNEPVSVTASIWDKNTSWSRVDALSDLIEHHIRTMGCPKMDGGRYRVFIGSTPFAQNMGDPDNDKIKRKVLNVNFEYMTEV